MSDSERRPEFMFSREDGSLIYVSSSIHVDGSYYRSFRLWAGRGDAMREIPVTSVMSYRDGGTTLVEAPEGSLYAPALETAKRQPSRWCDEVVTKVDPAAYEISESGDSLTIAAVTR